MMDSRRDSEILVASKLSSFIRGASCFGLHPPLSRLCFPSGGFTLGPELIDFFLREIFNTDEAV
jgi:hypothetical protein